MIAFGYIAGKFKLLSLESSVHISRMVLYLISPCVIIDAFQMEFSREKLMSFLLAAAAAIIIHIILIAVAYAAKKCFHFSKIEQASLIYTNCGNLLIPIIGYVLGKEYVFYCCAYVCVQSVLCWTHCISMIAGREYMNPKKIITNPNILAVVFGMILFFSHITLPDILASAISRTGDCVGPLSMFVIGIMIASANLKKVFTRPKSWLVTSLRLILCPLLVLLLFAATKSTSITADAENVLFVSFLAAGAPSASTVSQMANIYHSDEILAGSINIMTVLLCMISLPAMTMLYQIFCM